MIVYEAVHYPAYLYTGSCCDLGVFCCLLSLRKALTRFQHPLWKDNLEKLLTWLHLPAICQSLPTLL